MPEELERIVSKPEICGGQPTIRGTRMRVSDVLDLLAAGATRQEVLEDYSYLNEADITAALQYAARQSAHPVLTAAE